MKISIALLGLSLVVLAVMIFHAGHQELNLRGLKTLMAENLEEVERKEEAIVVMKNKVTEMKVALESANTKLDGLKKQKEELEKSTKEFDEKLNTCTNQKARDKQIMVALRAALCI